MVTSYLPDSLWSHRLPLIEALKTREPITWNAWTSRLKTLPRLTLITISTFLCFFENISLLLEDSDGISLWWVTQRQMLQQDKGADGKHWVSSLTQDLQRAFLKTEWHLKGFWNSQGCYMATKLTKSRACHILENWWVFRFPVLDCPK